MKLNDFVDLLVERKIMDAENIELVRFGLRQGLFYLLNIFITLSIGLFLHEFGSSICFLLCFMILRSYTGGYHAKSVYWCLITSTIVIGLVIGVIHFLTWQTEVSAVLIVISSVILWEISPIDSEKRMLSNKEKSIYKKIAHYIIFIEGFTALVFCCFKMENLLRATALALFVTCLLAGLGKFINKRRGRCNGVYDMGYRGV